jgi:uncharacterized membrane protein
MTVTNSGNAAKSYSFTVSGADWADVKVSPASLVVIEPGKSQTVTIFATVNKDASVGPHVATVTVNSGTEKLQEISLTANVTAAPANAWASVKTALAVSLIVLVALLIILGIIVGISRMKNEDEPAKPQTYY